MGDVNGLGLGAELCVFFVALSAFVSGQEITVYNSKVNGLNLSEVKTLMYMLAPLNLKQCNYCM